MNTTTEIMVTVWDDLSAAERERRFERGVEQIFDPGLMRSIRTLVEEVDADGDRALVRALARFDRCEVGPEELLVGAEEFERGCAAIDRDRDLVAALRTALANVRRFNEQVIREQEWRTELAPGLVVGERSTPIASAGLFVPCGKGSFPSVLVQVGMPAVVAGVAELTVAVPPLPGGKDVDPGVLWVARQLGIDRVLRSNGPAGVAAMALGTETVPRSRKVLGPGSPAVQAAQIICQLYGCHTQMLLGPTESAILADETADPALIAVDLLNEAEHGADSTSVLVTPSRRLLDAVLAELSSRARDLPEPRRSWALQAVGQNGGAFLVKDLDQAIEVVDRFAPEHLQLAGDEAEALAGSITNAGEILVGQSSLFTQANYVLGVPASLPTGGFAAVTGGVTAATFQKQTSVAHVSRAAMESLAPAALALAEHEGFPAHAAAVAARLPAEGALS